MTSENIYPQLIIIYLVLGWEMDKERNLHREIFGQAIDPEDWLSPGPRDLQSGYWIG